MVYKYGESVGQGIYDMVHHDLDELERADAESRAESRRVNMILAVGAVVAVVILLGGLFLW